MSDVQPVRVDKAVPPASRTLRFSGWSVAWAVWIAFFVVVEAAALVRKGPGDTFSEHWWSVFRVQRQVPWPGKVVLLVAQLSFGVWLVAHLSTGCCSL
ncbi:hypothetical protein [Actinomadura sp. 21ATH]|uniref:hypothetical protein n=1 Tax=Actinomadura sp. 21ATH TaxID=1735444 RepID=UPI0035BF09EC